MLLLALGIGVADAMPRRRHAIAPYAIAAIVAAIVGEILFTATAPLLALRRARAPWTAGGRARARQHAAGQPAHLRLRHRRLSLSAPSQRCARLNARELERAQLARRTTNRGCRRCRRASSRSSCSTRSWRPAVRADRQRARTHRRARSSICARRCRTVRELDASTLESRLQAIQACIEPSSCSTSMAKLRAPARVGSAHGGATHRRAHRLRARCRTCASRPRPSPRRPGSSRPGSTSSACVTAAARRVDRRRPEARACRPWCCCRWSTTAGLRNARRTARSTSVRAPATAACAFRSPRGAAARRGTGADKLARLRERLHTLYGDGAHLTLGIATIRIRYADHAGLPA